MLLSFIPLTMSKIHMHEIATQIVLFFVQTFNLFELSYD